MKLLTFGHGTSTAEALATLVKDSGIQFVFDVRTVPKSRRHPHVWREEMVQWIPELSGARYEWRQDLGGFRKPHPDSANVALEHPAFRGYADYMETPAFQTALAHILGIASKSAAAVMCSETLWWRCHRRLIADAAMLLYDVEVVHLFVTGKQTKHVPTRGVRVLEPGRLRYDRTT